MTCKNCGMEISVERQAAVPGEQWCKDCVEKAGDVEPIRGVMLWHHKTAPELYIGPGTDEILNGQRRGPHAQLGLGSKNSPVVVKSLQTFNLSSSLNLKDRPEPPSTLEPAVFHPSRCHPERPRVTPKGHCMECALLWYQQYQKHR